MEDRGLSRGSSPLLLFDQDGMLPSSGSFAVYRR